MLQGLIDANEVFDDMLVAHSSDDAFGLSYLKKHESRFRKTLEFIPPGAAGLEIGATTFFQVALRQAFGYERVSAFSFSGNIAEKSIEKYYSVGSLSVSNRTYSIDVESELFPFADGDLDFILCCEVIEHLDVDPMFMMFEMNRVLKKGGHVLITTPNACSARNLWKIAQGYRPHFFMQYSIDRSPYRHNFEYDVHGLVSLANGSGFSIARLETHDVFEAEHKKAWRFIRANDLPAENRGDDIFLLLQKTGAPTERYPADMYV
jgi:SAM-dependent methyltransferase